MGPSSSVSRHDPTPKATNEMQTRIQPQIQTRIITTPTPQNQTQYDSNSKKNPIPKKIILNINEKPSEPNRLGASKTAKKANPKTKTLRTKPAGSRQNREKGKSKKKLSEPNRMGAAKTPRTLHESFGATAWLRISAQEDQHLPTLADSYDRQNPTEDAHEALERFAGEEVSEVF
jgi:hypothetical protein